MRQTEPETKSLNLKESPPQDFITIILSTLKKEDTLTLKEKLEFTYILSLSKENFTEETVKEFCEEECDLTLINWIWKSKDKLKKFRVETELREKFLKIDKNVDEYFPKYNILLIEVNFILELLINILNLFSFLPITSFNILNLNLYQKLNKIKEYIKLYAGDKILSSLDLILIKWKSQIEAENEQKREAKEKLDYTISSLKEIQRADGYLGGSPSTPFDTVFSAKGNFSVERFSLADWWVPWYSIHKIYAGLLDAFIFAQNEDALKIVTKMADWAIEGTSKMSDEEIQKMLYCEHGGMLKVFADLYGITKNEKYLKEAERWIHKEIFEPLRQQKDVLQGYHANTQIPKILGLCRLYELTQKNEYRTAVEFFFKTVTENRSYAIGGNSKGEHFGKLLDEPLARDTAETCNTYNMLELAEHIFAWNKDSRTADFYERAIYNHILSSQDPKSGAKTYFVSLQPASFKVYGSHDNAMWCCTGTGLENPERYNRFVASEYDDTLFVNLFIPSTIKTKFGWTLSLETDFPYSDELSIRVLHAGEKPLSLKVRNPSWTKKESSAAQSDYLNYGALTADTNISLRFPMNLYLRHTRDGSGNFSVFFGPIVLAAELQDLKIPVDIVDEQLVYINDAPLSVPYVTCAQESPEKWISTLDRSKLLFKIDSKYLSDGKTQFLLKPFYQIHHARYCAYFSSDKKTDSESISAKNTLDVVEVARQQSEIEHGFEGKNAIQSFDAELDKNCRVSTEDGASILYRLKFDNQKNNTLALDFASFDSGDFSVYINGSLLNKETLVGQKSHTLLERKISVPKEFLLQKEENQTQTVQIVLQKDIHLFHVRVEL